MEWINVEDELPENRKIVLVYGGAFEHPKVKMYDESLYAGGFLDSLVTHWMPLPDPPG